MDVGWYVQRPSALLDNFGDFKDRVLGLRQEKLLVLLEGLGFVSAAHHVDLSPIHQLHLLDVALSRLEEHDGVLLAAVQSQEAHVVAVGAARAANRGVPHDAVQEPHEPIHFRERKLRIARAEARCVLLRVVALHRCEPRVGSESDALHLGVGGVVEIERALPVRVRDLRRLLHVLLHRSQGRCPRRRVSADRTRRSAVDLRHKITGIENFCCRIPNAPLCSSRAFRPPPPQKLRSLAEKGCSLSFPLDAKDRQPQGRSSPCC
mmetsp:Transcript_6632/g.15414  ORF Transcript_6632/g.15414 Transcript_6632/m.15414 type:complete len:263 (+) Transcript_6632:655-1443(+)